MKRKNQRGSTWVEFHSRPGGTTGTNSCSVTVNTIASTIASSAIGLPASNFKVTLAADSGIVIACNPLNSCYGNSTVWPPSAYSDNLVGKKSDSLSRVLLPSGAGDVLAGSRCSEVLPAS